MSREELNKKIKIAYVITKSEPFGGAQKYVYDLARSLDPHIFDVTVISGGKGTLIDKLKEQNINVITLPWIERNFSLSREFRTLFALVKVFQKIKPDVIHLNSSKIGGIGSFAGRLTNIKRIIFTAHGWAFNESRGMISKVMIKLLYWLTIILCHHTIAVSHATKAQVSNWPFIKNRISVIHNGIEPPEFIERASARSYLSSFLPEHVSRNEIWIGTVAELHPIKGHMSLIKAARLVIEQNPQVHFIFIGEGEEHKKIEEQVHVYELGDNIHLCGYIDNAVNYLKAFDMFILPSLSEALGLAIIEAGMAGLPTIASNVGGIPEIIENEKEGLLVEPQNHEDLLSKILFSLNNPEQIKHMSKEIHKKTHTEYSLVKTIRETVDIYKN